jgi:hypothetical protein
VRWSFRGAGPCAVSEHRPGIHLKSARRGCDSLFGSGLGCSFLTGGFCARRSAEQRSAGFEKCALVDRQNDRYLERVWDPESGDIIHECEEPLTQHAGHGSAKAKKPTEED